MTRAFVSPTVKQFDRPATPADRDLRPERGDQRQLVQESLLRCPDRDGSEQRS